MNYKEIIREAIRCPQFGDDWYGEWGALRYEQRLLIKRLLDECDSADSYIRKLYLEKQELKKQLEVGKEQYNNLVEEKEKLEVQLSNSHQIKNQQKEFIEWLEDMLVSELDIFTVIRVSDVLSKYKEITGVEM